jgi:hypothetical protein
MVFAKPALGQLGDMHDLQLRVGRRNLFEQVTRLVLRTVVDGDDLEIRVIQREHGRHGVEHGSGLVARGEDHRDARPGRRRRHRQPGEALQTTVSAKDLLPDEEPPKQDGRGDGEGKGHGRRAKG